ncbi:class IV adenylate cyclase [Nonomuraea sp. NPDC059023]|uniref:class IV adenylate cyclase n=1 Tax=unclassified Nonomuraea TaxID=2593643 RepID=UPI0036AC8FAA
MTWATWEVGVTGGVQEVEVKYRVEDLSGLEDALAARGAILSTPVVQDDQAFAQGGWTYGQSKIGAAFARLRTQQGRHLFTVKKPLDNAMACLEHETEVADRAQMHEAIVAMGFYPTVRIVKRRRTGELDGVALCVDEVEHAGLFVEFERLVADTASGAAAQRELDRLARSLGVELIPVSDTYDSLVRAALSGV